MTTYCSIFVYLEVVVGRNGVVISKIEEKLISSHFLTLDFSFGQTTSATLVSSSLNFVRKCQPVSFEKILIKNIELELLIFVLEFLK